MEDCCSTNLKETRVERNGICPSCKNKAKNVKLITLKSLLKPIEQIRENIHKNRCGCEVNNPQGSCCFGNVTKYIKSI
ncbi:hypothetical protein ACQKND_04340 [Viridibacillus arvi]|uniref:hypothetical protein n=1 Tax=Viridibacillus arvi TaxID=263475 RepID=UPI003D023B63